MTALEAALGDPVDAYVNGSQVWIDEEGPDGIAIEWRLHPVATYEKPAGMTTSYLFAAIVDGCAGETPEQIDPASLWDGVEAFAAYDDAVELDTLKAWAIQRIGLEPTAAGLVDHEVIALAWERAERRRSIVDDLLAQIAGDHSTVSN